MQKSEEKVNLNDLRPKIYHSIRKHHGALTELAKRRNCTTEWCRLVLQGKGNDLDLLEEACKVWAEYEDVLTDRLSKINAAVTVAETKMNHNLQLV